MFVSKSYNLDNCTADSSFSIHITGVDGLPVMPPSHEAVKNLLEWFKIAPEHQIDIEPFRSHAIPAEKLAIIALIRFNDAVA